MAARPRSAILCGLLADEFFDAEFHSLPSIERANAFVEFLAEAPELLDMRQELPTDLFLIRVGKSCNFRYCLFERLDHPRSVPHRLNMEMLPSAAPLAASVGRGSSFARIGCHCANSIKCTVTVTTITRLSALSP